MYGQIRKFYMIGDLRSDNGQYFVIEQGTLDDYPLFAQLAFCSSRDRNGLLSELSVLWNAPILVAQSSVNTPVLQSLDKLSGQWGSSELKRSRSLADDGQTGTNQIVGTKEMGLSAGLGPPPKLRDGFSSTQLHEDQRR